MKIKATPKSESVAWYVKQQQVNATKHVTTKTIIKFKATHIIPTKTIIIIITSSPFNPNDLRVTSIITKKKTTYYERK